MDSNNASAVASTVLDGRVERGKRSRLAIVEALLTLVGDGVLEPTAEEVAEQAGVGIRTVFRHFNDMDSLYGEMDAYIRESVQLYIAAGAAPRGDLKTKATLMVKTRCKVFERIGPFLRANNAKRQRSEFLQECYEVHVAELRTLMLDWLSELNDADEATVNAIEIATSFETWDRLRMAQGLSKKRAEEVVERMVVSLIDSI